jgi:hypothetical protein
MTTITNVITNIVTTIRTSTSVVITEERPEKFLVTSLALGYVKAAGAVEGRAAFTRV